jgi:hypothetical protein
MTIKRPMSDETFRALTALVLAGRGAYAYPDPKIVAAISRLGWCTPDGEITRAGEDAFADAQEERAARRNAPPMRSMTSTTSDLRNPVRRCPFR